ncbi:hypothetical protein L1887_31974 [Cichorium endivia]|nr:hypothetical protein L1887_31974 [Cichorium endivia]
MRRHAYPIFRPYKMERRQPYQIAMHQSLVIFTVIRASATTNLSLHGDFPMELLTFPFALSFLSSSTGIYLYNLQ